MKRSVAAAVFLASLSIASAEPVPAIPTAAAAAVFARAHALCSADGGRLWGVSLCGPMMLADPRADRAIANVPLSGAARDGAYYRFTLPSDATIANAPFEYDGTRWAQIVWPLTGSSEEQAVTLVHELFHRVQPRLGFVVSRSGSGASISGSEALDTEAGRIWFRGELHALRIALTSHGAARRTALADALALRAYRDALLPSTVAPEHELDVIEGLAESTGIDVALPVGRRVAYALYDMSLVERAPSYAREFPYAIGPAYSEVLDAAEPHWRRGVTQATSIASLAARAYGIHVLTPSASRAQAILGRYGGAAIAREESARAREVAARDGRYRTEFLTGPTLRLPMKDFKIDFNPSEVERFGRYGSVYHHVTVSAPWGTIVVFGGDALIDSGFQTLTVAARGSAVRARPHGMGWTLHLAPGTWIVGDPAKPGSYTIARERP